MKYFSLAFVIAAGIITACNSAKNANTANADNSPKNTSMAQTSIIKEGAQLQLIGSNFKFTEGPAVNRKGDVYFTDQPNDKIWRYTTNGVLELFMEKTGRSNGLYFDNSDVLVACADEQNQLWRIDAYKKVTVLLTDVDGKKLNGPNDLWIHPVNNSIYFTDPYYHRPYWTRKEPEITGQKVYYLAAGAAQPVVVDDSLKKPNGIIGTKDGKHLFVADIEDNKTYKYTIDLEGKLTGRQLFAPQGSDGMTIDNLGNIYLTGDGVTVYNKEGQKIEHIKVPAKWTANVCFAGNEKDKLFITASESVYLLPMNVKGVQ